MESKGLLSNKWLIGSLFVFLFGHAIIRTWTVVPILDELATFYTYIQSGHYFSTIELLDANNHVLNSFFGHQFYRLFGDHFFLFRLASLLTFPIYFFSLKYIVQRSISSKLNVIVFVALISIPWVFEYFSYSRGYGMAIAFFFATIACIIKWKETGKTKHFVLIFISLILTVASSLTYLMPSMLLFLFVLLLFVLNFKRFKEKLVPSVLVIICWFAALVPFIRYSFELKDAGALWWGNQDGLWETTGKSLSRLVLFTEGSWVLYLVSVLLLFGLVTFVLSWKEKGLWTYLKETESMIILTLVGVIIGIVLMRYLFDVNYPMDRVGMFLVPLFILYLGVSLSKNRYSRYALLGLLFFPISFIVKFNISTSIFSPEDRIPTYLSDQIKSTLNEDTALSAEYVSHMSYAYSCRNDDAVHMAQTAEKGDNYFGDYHIIWLDGPPMDGYKKIKQDEDSRTRFLKRIDQPKKVLVADTLVENVSTSEMYYTLFEKDIDSSLQSKKIQFEISGELKLDEITSSFNFIERVMGANDEVTADSSPNFRWYFSDRKDIKFTFTDRTLQLKPEDKALQLFFMNADLRKVDIDFIRVRVYEIQLE